MNFKINCEEIDGLIILDKSTLGDISEELIISLDILLDVLGESELIYDFPDEGWDNVRKRETLDLRKFCNDGNMVIWLNHNEIYTDSIIEKSNVSRGSNAWVNCSSGCLVIVSASELIQTYSDDELEMEKMLEINIEPGWYEISGDWNKVIICKGEKAEQCCNIKEEGYV